MLEWILYILLAIVVIAGSFVIAILVGQAIASHRMHGATQRDPSAWQRPGNDR